MNAIEEVRRAACNAAFGRPLVTNVLRGIVVEAIVARALGDMWRWCASDYSAWDFERSDGLRLQVKQAARRQSWTDTGARPSRAVFDIAPRLGRWEGSTWLSGERRFAEIYVCGHHTRFDDTADHRDPDQWTFYVVAADVLPPQRSIALSRLAGIARVCDAQALSRTVDAVSRDVKVAA